MLESGDQFQIGRRDACIRGSHRVQQELEFFEKLACANLRHSVRVQHPFSPPFFEKFKAWHARTSGVALKTNAHATVQRSTVSKATTNAQQAALAFTTPGLLVSFPDKPQEKTPDDPAEGESTGYAPPQVRAVWSGRRQTAAATATQQPGGDPRTRSTFQRTSPAAAG